MLYSIPIRGTVTYNSRSINFPSRFSGYEKISDSWDQREAIAGQEIFPLERVHLLGFPATKKSEVDIERHAQRPVDINTLKPENLPSAKVSIFSGNTGIVGTVAITFG